METIRAEFERTLEFFMGALPNVLGALGLTVLALILARVISEFVRRRVDKSKIGVIANREAMGPGRP